MAGKGFYPDNTLEDLVGMFASMGRGVGTATLGLPGDLARLGHHIGNFAARTVGLPENPELPRGATYGSDYTRRNISQLPENLRHDWAQESGSMLPLTPGQALKVASSPLGKAGLSMLAAAHGIPMGGLESVGGAMAGVVKRECGNWREDSIVNAVDRL